MSMTSKTQDSSQVFSVSQAIQHAKHVLDMLPLCIEGEVSQVSNKPGYKAVYFTIKDNNAALPCMMWVNRYVQAGVEIKVGALVRVCGKLSIYAAKGTMNFDVATLELAGKGDIREKIAQLAKKLAAQGLTADSRKRALPVFPEKVGLVTSPRGAAVHDVLRTLRRRYPFAQVLFAGVPVEGAHAAQDIAAGVEAVVYAGAELVLVVRGGGSFEDLMPFNDEHLARALAASPVPIVTGIGHEPDTTIADLVADLRCSTPTAAAEAISPEDGYLDTMLAQTAVTMKASMERLLHVGTLQVNAQANRALFKDSQAFLAQEWLGLDYVSDRLSRAIPVSLSRDETTLKVAQTSLTKLSRTLLLMHQQTCANTTGRLNNAVTGRFDALEARLSLNAAQMNSLSPLAVLGRGYSIAFKENGAVVREVNDVDVGQTVLVRLREGSLSCEVKAKNTNDSSCEKEQ